MELPPNLRGMMTQNAGLRNGLMSKDWDGWVHQADWLSTGTVGWETRDKHSEKGLAKTMAEGS
jgi:hypothetical protein